MKPIMLWALQNTLHLVIVPLLLLICGCPSSPPKGIAIDVPSKPISWRADVLTPTAIEVKAGNTLVFTASGSWSVGVGVVGPNGRQDWCECVVAEAVGSGFRGPLGALIGRIGRQGQPFFIGTGTEIKASESGILFLGANDNMGPCNGVERGSCYSDNIGSVRVWVEVK